MSSHNITGIDSYYVILNSGNNYAKNVILIKLKQKLASFSNFKKLQISFAYKFFLQQD
jgi:hypothetical protein